MKNWSLGRFCHSRNGASQGTGRVYEAQVEGSPEQSEAANLLCISMDIAERTQQVETYF